jgi:hypothetical protein
MKVGGLGGHPARSYSTATIGNEERVIMTYGDRNNKGSGVDVGLNPTAAKTPPSSLVESALNNPIRKRCGFNILFAGLDKAPKLPWERWQSQPQSNEDIQAYYNGMGAINVTCWGFVTGYRTLEGIDFDWAWVYRLWKTKFGERADTLTVQTPNGGLRPHYLCEEHETHDKFKESLHVELKGPGRFVVYEGKANREDGSIGEYKVVNDKPIREDNNVVADTLTFLEETYRRYCFLWWNCLRPYFKKKVLGEPSHELRLFLSDVMICEGFSDDEIHNLFCAFADYEHKKTQDQLDYTKQRVKDGLKPPTCETLWKNLSWSEEGCVGCPRRSRPSTKQQITEGETKERESQASSLVKLAIEASEKLFHDERKEPYIRIRRGEALVTLRLRSKEARTWLSVLLWKDKAKAPNSEALSSSLNVLEAKANEGEEHRLYNRAAPGEDESIWLDLCDEEWRAIHITRAGWEVVKHPPIIFRRYSHQQPIPIPVSSGSLVLILDYANITHLGDQLLYVVTAITYLIPAIPHVAIILFGPQGSGKSWALRVIRILVDPSQLDLLSLPTRYPELVQNLDHNWCAFYDNVGRLPPWQNNMFCRAVTGAGISKRQLYTDDEDVIYQYHRCVGLTDINIAAERGDLLQRSILLSLDAIPEKSRKTEKELKATLERQRPEILGAMLDILVKAMSFYSTAKLDSLHRMADFVVWGRAITEALGLEPKYFNEAYEENINAQNLEVVRASPISDALVKLMESYPLGWSGTASQLYSELEEQAKELKISTRQKAWPKQPHVLSRVLNELAPSLPAVGLEVERGYREKTRTIHITTVGSVGSVGETARQADWGKGRDLRNYLDEDTAATVASAAIPISFSGGLPKNSALCDKCFSQHRGARVVGKPLPEYICIECGDKATVVAKFSYEQRAGKMALGDLLPVLRKEWTSGLEADFITLAVEKGNWTKEEAKQLYDQLVEEGRILRDPDGFWRWVK